MTKGEREQLEQLNKAGLRGVWAGDLIDKTSTRELVRRGLADNGARGHGSPSALSTVYITKAGRDALAAIEKKGRTMSTIPEFAVYVTAADGSEARVTGEGKALDSVERALAFMGARWNSSVETWDFGYYSETPKPDARPLYKVCGDIIRAQSEKGRVPAGLIDELCRSILAADEQIKGYEEAA